MSFLDPDRFHRAARDGHLDLLQEANRKELNSKDEDGMTPAMWAAYYGHLDALRLIVGRGGDPDKCDHYGNTCLHCAAGNGHTDCVSFLIHFGVNLWALDNDFHTAKDVAAINQKDAVLRLLDQAQSKHSLVNRKLVQRLKEKSVYDAEKRIKQYRKMQTKAAKKAEKEDKQRTNKDTRFLYAPKFSDIVNVSEKKDHGVLTKPSSVVGRKKKNVAFKTGDIVIDADSENRNRSKTLFNRTTGIIGPTKESDDGTSSPDNPSRQTSDTQSSDDANSDVLQTADSGIGEELPDCTNSSIFDRPGFGTVTFRNSVVNLSSIIQETNSRENPIDKNRNVLNKLRTRLQVHKNSFAEIWPQDHLQGGHKSNSVIKNGCSTLSDSIGSASSLVRRHITWEDECDYDDADDDATDEEEDTDDDDDDDDYGEPLSLFLTTVGLAEYIPLFQSEQIDLESLSLLSEDDFKALGMPLGPRRKLENAIQQRIKTLQEPGIVQDSRL